MQEIHNYPLYTHSNVTLSVVAVNVVIELVVFIMYAGAKNKFKHAKENFPASRYRSHKLDEDLLNPFNSKRKRSCRQG